MHNSWHFDLHGNGIHLWMGINGNCHLVFAIIMYNELYHCKGESTMNNNENREIKIIPKNTIFFFRITKFQTKITTKELNAYSKAANVAEEVLSGVRTVFAFGGEKIEVERYRRRLLPAENAARKKGSFACIGDALTRILYFACCALATWFGAQWVIQDRDKERKTYTTAILIIVI